MPGHSSGMLPTTPELAPIASLTLARGIYYSGEERLQIWRRLAANSTLKDVRLMSGPGIKRRNSLFLLVLTMLCAVVACHDAATSRRVESSAPAKNEAGALPPARTGPLPIKLTAVDGQDIRFRRLPGGTGLSQTRVGWVVQDHLGFIWFATQYGLNRYDGYRSKVFKHEPGRSDSLG